MNLRTLIAAYLDPWRIAAAANSGICSLSHQAEIDQYLVDTEREFEGNSIPMAEEKPALWERLQRAKAKMGESRL